MFFRRSTLFWFAHTRRSFPAVPEKGAEASPSPPAGVQGARKKLRSPVRLLAVLGSSAVFGGVALVFWNRRSLQGLREAKAPTAEPEPEREFV